MTLGYGPPRAKCPHCAIEGIVSDNQYVQESHGASRRPLADSVRFNCSGNCGSWNVPIEDALLMGAFLDRQDALA